jgi:hypothetical protein
MVFVVSNIPIRVPTHFMGRDDALTSIETALKRYEGPRPEHGAARAARRHACRGVRRAPSRRLPGNLVGRAQAETTMRADLVALGIRLGSVGADAKEAQAVDTVMERLRHEGEGQRGHADALKPYLPRGGATRVLITSNARARRGIAAPVEIRLWPKEIGADYLIARAGRPAEQHVVEAASRRAARCAFCRHAFEQNLACCASWPIRSGTSRTHVPCRMPGNGQLKSVTNSPICGRSIFDAITIVII